MSTHQAAAYPQGTTHVLHGHPYKTRTDRVFRWDGYIWRVSSVTLHQLNRHGEKVENNG